MVSIQDENIVFLESEIERVERELEEAGGTASGNVERSEKIMVDSYDEKRKHFLWRFWTDVPGLGGFALFDRSWDGRVLVEFVSANPTGPLPAGHARGAG